MAICGRHGWEDLCKALQGLCKTCLLQRRVSEPAVQSQLWPILLVQDANMVDRSLTKTDVDIIFAKVLQPLGQLGGSSRLKILV